MVKIPQKIGCIPSLIIFITVIAFIGYLSDEFGNNSTSNKSEYNQNKKVTKFILTECLGMEMPKNATFNIPTNGDNWSIDFNNGDVIIYKLQTLNKYNMLCGITAIDNFGDNCEICITPDGDKKAIITFKYGSKTITYKGYAE